jgi:hypothetical protein
MTFKINKSQLRDPAKFREMVDTHIRELTDHRAHMVRVREDEKTPAPDQPNPADFGTGEEHRFHEFQAARDAHHAVMLKRHAPYPPPEAHPMVDSAIAINSKGEYVADYEIVNDDPKPDQLLAARKEALTREIVLAEKLAVDKIMSPNKRRLVEMAVGDVHAQEMKVADEARAANAETMTKFRVEYETAFGKLESERGERMRALSAMRADLNDRIHEHAEKIAGTSKLRKIAETLGVVSPPPSPTLSAEDRVREAEHLEFLTKTHKLPKEPMLVDPEEHRMAQRRPEHSELLSLRAEVNEKIASVHRRATLMLSAVEDLTLENMNEFKVEDLNA